MWRAGQDSRSGHACVSWMYPSLPSLLLGSQSRLGGVQLLVLIPLLATSGFVALTHLMLSLCGERAESNMTSAKTIRIQFLVLSCSFSSLQSGFVCL